MRDTSKHAAKMPPGVKDFLSQLRAESDRGCALISASILDERLADLCRLTFVRDKKVQETIVPRLFSAPGPFSSFWSKIMFCRAADLINSSQYEDLEKIRKIRNLFAHSYGRVRFSDDAVVKLCSKLQAANDAVEYLPAQKHLPQKHASKKGVSTKEQLRRKERMRFVLSVSFLGGSLSGFAEGFASVSRVTKVPLSLPAKAN